MLRKFAALFLAVVMAMTMPFLPAALAEPSAAPGAETALLFERAAENGLFETIEGEWKPEDDLTRAQMASILNCAFGAVEEAPLTSFTDLDANSWYYGEMAKAVQMGIFPTDGDTLNPQGVLTKEEVFMALARVFKLPDGDTSVLDSLKDKESLSADSQSAAAALLFAGFITPADGNLNPKANETISGFVKILDSMVQCYVSEAGTYTSLPEGSVMINVPDVTLKDVVVKGDLILGDGIGEGTVTLHNVTVTGRTLIRGGGAHSIRITGTSSLQNITIARVNGELRVFAQDGTEIGEVLVDGKDDVTLEGDFGSVTLASDDVTVMAVNAQLGSASITGNHSRIIVGSGSKITTLTVDAANAALEISGTVANIIVNGEGAAISGEGRVETVTANANNVVVTTADTLVTAAAGVSGVIAGTRQVSGGSTVNTTPDDGGSTSGAKPEITSISPAQGPALGGTTVTITGKYFTGATSVTFGTTKAASYKVVSKTTITAVTPSGTPGTADVKVTTADGTATAKAAYTYIPGPAITSVIPNKGPMAGGTTVSITGTNLTGATAVSFGGAAAASFAVVSDTQITAVTPSSVQGPADVKVETPYGTAVQAGGYTFAPPPQVHSISPAYGPLAGGSTVTITGENLTEALSVAIGAAQATSFTVVSDTELTAITPAGFAGPAAVTVTTPGGTHSNDLYTYKPAPVIASASPNKGPAAGGATVSITGENFTAATLVTFGGAAAASFTVESDTSITAVTPAGTPGTADIAVTAAGGTAAKPAAYTYIPSPTITSLSPNKGVTAGGNMVTITGTAFTGAASVTFGGVAAASFTVVSDTTITAVVPAGTPGAADIGVTTIGGTYTLPAGYTYIPAPSITSVSPDKGPTVGGTTVTIHGSHFTDATAVNLGSAAAASFTVVSDTQITAVTPAASPSTVDVQVVTPYGTGVKQGGYSFVAPPLVTSISSGRGPLVGGNTIIITGENLSYVTSVEFSGVAAASFTVVFDNMISIVAPANTAGPATITMRTPGGMVVTPYEYISPPSVTSVSPNKGSTNGGETVIITGENFVYTTAVTFGGVAAASFAENSNTQITAVAPASTSGTVDVRVVTPFGEGTKEGGYTFVPPPDVNSISYNSAPLAGGNTVRITGVNLSQTTAVTFGAVPATSFAVISDTEITAIAPAGSAGTVYVYVTTPGGSDLAPYTYMAAPVITSLSPSSGTAGGGTQVTISGENFIYAKSVTFGGVAAANFWSISDTSLIAVTPPGALGAVDVAVSAMGGSTTSQAAYTYIPSPYISAFGPSIGPAAGGEQVQIDGNYFTGTTAVTFGGVPAAFTVVSDTRLTAITPPGVPGTADLSVTNAYGTETWANAYTYMPGPAITSVSPNKGPVSGGTTVILTGSHFSGASAVSIDGAVASFTVDSDTQITVVTAAAIQGTVDVQVVTQYGTGIKTGGFTYLAPPAIDSISPVSGPMAGGNAVTITGQNLAYATSVIFGTAPASSFTVVSNTQITAAAPANAAGTVNITVMTPGGSDDFGPYTYKLPPVITSLSPDKGTTSGGSTVFISGEGFTGATAVSFGGKAAYSFTVNSDTQIRAVTMASDPGLVDVQVVAPHGTAPKTGAYTYVYPPHISGISSAYGPLGGGNTVTILGANLTGTTSVKFNDVPGTSLTVVSDAEISVVVPAGAAGPAGVAVTTPGGIYWSSIYNYKPAPVISSVTPGGGTTDGGTSVTIIGVNFSGASAVSFGGVAAASFAEISDTEISAVTHARAQGLADVTVTAAGGTATAPDAYTYMVAPSITSVSPAKGSTAGGTVVTITGSRFSAATAVSFGGVAAASFTVDSPSQITAVTPSCAPGTVDVKVEVSYVSATKAGAFTFVPPPSIISVFHDSGPTTGGNTVIITGQNLSETTSVTFGGAQATSLTIVSDMEINMVAPAGAAGTVPVTVTTIGGANSAFTYKYVAAPVITSVSPNEGSVSGNTNVTITGENLTGATSVAFGGTATTDFAVVSDTSIVVFTPAGLPGPADVSVTAIGGTGTLASAFTYVNPPVLTTVYPSSSPTTGGATVILNGSNFTGATDVSFDGIPATDFRVDSDSQITATTPAHTAGTASITVLTAYGTGILPTSIFYYTEAAITSVSPNAGPTAGGTSVTITGAGFTGTTEVSFGGIHAMSFTIVSDTEISAVTPANESGAASVSVTTAYSSATKSSAFVYKAAPSITYVGPNIGSTTGGTAVTITGTNFTGTSAVTFGSAPAASFVAVSDTEISVFTPAGFPGPTDVSVTAIGGTGTGLGVYTYVPAPTITSVSPNIGPLAGGTSVTLTGTGFTGTSAVAFGGVSAITFTVNSDTQITAVTPANSAGLVNVSVTTAGGTGTLASSFTYGSTPSIASISPNVGPLTGGTLVTINGSGFTGTSAVTFGSTSATSFTVVSDTQITATTPANDVGVVSVSVTNTMGTGMIPSAFTYGNPPVITGVSPNSSSTSVAAGVTITGTGFTGVTAVTFGGTPVLSFSVDSDTEITVIASPHSSGTVSVSATNPFGTGTLSSAFTYYDMPSTTSISPTYGPIFGGTSVTITGTNFTGATAVSFGGTPAVGFTVVSDTQITATTPAHDAGSVNVSVSNDYGTGPAGAAYSFIND